MPTYTVHEPRPVSGTLDERAMRLKFVKEGFAWLALLIPALWLLLNRLWLELITYLVLAIGLVALLNYADASQEAIAWVMFFINLACGFEARNLHRSALARRGYELIGVVTGRDLEDAERRFLTEWLPEARKEGGEAALPPVSGQPAPMQTHAGVSGGGNPVGMSAMGIGLAPS
jgi:hypothetical protein